MGRVSGDWLTQTGTQTVCAMLSDAGFQAFLVGGCVRNSLLGVAVADVDIASDALPDQVERLAKKSGLKSIPTGKDHGTITVLADNKAFEVTTFRKDIQTDGRRAVVAFSDDLKTDASRRDFTMNALYALADGTVVDPLEGLPDLLARLVRFIGDPQERIVEDSLRILRFFRFTAHFGDPDNGIDADGLAACAMNTERLDGLSKERIGAEMIKLLSAYDPAPALASMASAGVLMRLLPGASADGLAPLVHFEQAGGFLPNWIRRLAAMGGEEVAKNLRLSKKQSAEMDLTAKLVGAVVSIEEMAYRHGSSVAINVSLVRAALLGTTPPAYLSGLAEQAAKQKFPVSSADLMPKYQGADLGRQLKLLEDRWIKSGFTETKAMLLS